MKKLLTAGLTVLFAITAAAQKAEFPKDPYDTISMKQKAEVQALWRKYNKAVSYKSRESALIALKAKSAGYGMYTDFERAGDLIVNLRSEKDWNRYESEKTKLHSELIQNGFYLSAVLYTQNDSLPSFVAKYGSELEKRRSAEYTAFYSSSIIPGKYIRNDLEAVMASTRAGSRFLTELLKYTEGEYPGHQLVRIESITNSSKSRKDRIAALESLKKENKGNAAGLLIEDRIIREEWQAVTNSGKTEEATCIALNERCLALEKAWKAYKGEDRDLLEAEVCDAGGIRATLTAENFSVRKKNNRQLEVTYRNAEKLDLKITGDNGSFRKEYVLQKKHLYVQDTIYVPIPELPDGKYKGYANGNEAFSLNIYSLGALTRSWGGRQEMYVADARTGMPLEQADIYSTTAGKKQKKESKCLKRKAFQLSGFTTVPITARKPTDCIEFWMKDSGGRMTARINTNYYTEEDAEKDIAYSGVINLACTVLNPGDTLKFKGIVSVEEKDGSRHTVAEGMDVLLQFIAPDSNLPADSLLLKTNVFGSVSGSYPLPDNGKNGYCTVSMSIFPGTPDERFIALEMATVGEIVLPEYELNWEPLNRVAALKDSLTLRGQLKYLSGHAAAGASIEWSCSDTSGVAGTDSQGWFSIPYYASHKADRVKLKATDIRGETQEFEKRLDFVPNLSVSIGDMKENVWTSSAANVIEGTSLKAAWACKGPDGSAATIPVCYTISKKNGDAWTDISSGKTESGRTELIELSAYGDGLYRINATGKTGFAEEPEASASFAIVTADPSYPLDWYLEKGDGLSVKFGSTADELWAVAEVWGLNDNAESIRLATRNIHVSKAIGTISFQPEESWPSEVQISISWIKNYLSCTKTVNFLLPKQEIKAEFSSFPEETGPKESEEFCISTAPGTECCVTIYDTAADAIQHNRWNNLYRSDITPAAPWARFSPSGAVVNPVYQHAWEGIYGSNKLHNTLVVGYGVKVRGSSSSRKLLSNRKAAVLSDQISMSDNAVEEAMPFQLSESKPVFSANGEDNEVREDFASALAFLPELYPDADGIIRFKVNTSDRLSRFVVRAMVHSKDAKSTIIEKQLTVTQAAKVAIMQPQVLWEGDRYIASVIVSNASQRRLEGRLSLNGQSRELTVDASASATARFEPGSIDEGSMELNIRFDADHAHDAIRVNVPVRKAAQSINECHSAILLASDDENIVKDSLSAAFTAVPGNDIVFEKRSIAQMLDELGTELSTPSREDAISLANALLVQHLTARADSSTAVSFENKLAACRNSDGGFGWMPGMKSSPAITAMVLDRFSRMNRADTLAVAYLDAACLGKTAEALWRGGIPDEEYFYIRSRFAGIPLAEKARLGMRSSARDWLDPNKKWTKYSSTLSKVYRSSTVLNLVSSEEGLALAKSFGLKINADKRLRQTLTEAAASLCEYAVEHSSGGIYYPNAVMPWRGLMQSEAFAHTLISDLLRGVSRTDNAHAAEAGRIADGISLWLMTQRETQNWTEEPAYALACASIREASDSILQTSVLIARASAELPLAEVKASGNGMTVERIWMVEKDGKWVALKDGETLHVGQRIRSEIKLWSKENRSFVTVTAPRPGCVMPVNQLSGMHWGYYRNVRGWCVEYLFDSFAEGKQSITDEFNVTQEGTFHYPASEIVCTYADHYRANEKAQAEMITSR